MILFNRLFITTLFLSIMFISCESEDETEGVDLDNTEETSDFIENEYDEYLETIVVKEDDLDYDSIPIDEILVQTDVDDILLATTVDTNLLSIPWFDDGNIYFLVAASEMKDWEGFLLIFSKNNEEGELVYQNVSLQENFYHWIGVNAWGDNNRGTLRIVPYSGNNKTHYWGKSRTYYPWFNTITGSNTLLVTPSDWDPNGE